MITDQCNTIRNVALQGYCVDKNHLDRNSGTVKFWNYPTQESCVNMCMSLAAKYKATGCEYSYAKGCDIHTHPICYGNGGNTHVCWIF